MRVVGPYICACGWCAADSRGLTTEEEDEGGAIVPGPDGRLISSDERIQQVRQVQAEAAAGGASPPPPAAAGGRGTPEGKQRPT